MPVASPWKALEAVAKQSCRELGCRVWCGGSGKRQHTLTLLGHVEASSLGQGTWLRWPRAGPPCHGEQ